MAIISQLCRDTAKSIIVSWCSLQDLKLEELQINQKRYSYPIYKKQLRLLAVNLKAYP
jgi:hypothetical protein